MFYRVIIFIFFILLESCSPDFNRSRYRSKFHKSWHRKKIIIYKQDRYNSPIIYKEAKRKMLSPPKINLDSW